jgi:hypothetical protein
MAQNELTFIMGGSKLWSGVVPPSSQSMWEMIYVVVIVVVDAVGSDRNWRWNGV